MFSENSDKYRACAIAALLTTGIAASNPAAAQRTRGPLSDPFLNGGRWCNIEEAPGRDGNTAPNTWLGGIVPYRFNTNVNAQNQQRALDAMATIEAVCDVDFIPWTNEAGYIFFNAHCCINSSTVGYSGGPGTINISGVEKDVAGLRCLFSCPGCAR